MTQATARGQVPRAPTSSGDSQGALAALSDLRDAIRTTPEVEYKPFELTAGDYPIVMRTSVQSVVGVTAVGAWNLDSPTTAAYVRGVAWDRGDTAGDIRLNGLENLTSGTRYRVTIKIEGER